MQLELFCRPPTCISTPTRTSTNRIRTSWTLVHKFIGARRTIRRISTVADSNHFRHHGGRRPEEEWASRHVWDATESSKRAGSAEEVVKEKLEDGYVN